MRPPTIVAATPPRSVQPSNGVFFDFERIAAADDRDAQIRREDRDVGRRTLGQRSAGHAQDPRRVHRQQLDQPRQRDDAGMDEAIEAERHGGLEAGDPERRAVELHVLLVVVMRRVVGGDDVDAAVGKARPASRRDRPVSRSGGFILTFVS